MNKLKCILVGAFATLALTSCLDEFRELNTNPELLGSTDPRNVFTGATDNWNNASRTHLVSKYSGIMQQMQYVVFYNGAQENIYVESVGNRHPSPYLPYYNDYFEQIGLKLRYLVNTVIPSNPESERYQNIAAIANILETYEAWLMFDVVGAAPYTEAFKLATEGIRTPKYDMYKDLYKTFDAKIKTNVELLQRVTDNQYNLDKNDFFYKGDEAKWIKFGNTLRIKMAQRLEKADNDFFKSVLNEVLSNPSGIISNNEESCIYSHSNDYSNNTDDVCILTYQYCASRALVNFLTTYNDPRLPLLIRRNGFGKGNNNKLNDEAADTLIKYYPDYQIQFTQWKDRYVGMAANPDSVSSDWSGSSYYTLPYEDDKGVARTMSIRHNSQIESRFYVKNGGKVGTQVTARDKEDEAYDVSQESISLFTPLITYPEVCFMMAEIALKAGSSQAGKNAITWFRDGIQASMLQYQKWAEKMKVPSAMNPNSDNYNPITTDKIDSYLRQSEFETVTLDKIVSQQWVNLFMRPEEAWATWKRTGLPAFKDQPIPESGIAFLETIRKGENMLTIPRRLALTAPNTANLDNYNAALQELIAEPYYGMGVENTEGRIWWDVP
ncbi:MULTISPECIES: SusD/RagB family nutrient-binding outer membrane lipoprotein [Bacteroides]|uniref:SusD/RagB family nutrient-binding outer membrane lipoprotein n=1 Tax=Bacteroides TaxID=816 RepID=UPI0004B6F8F2|nr:SusD/RagB family nutrient-binding outer membrane lipoprotein [Bacteroides neonati]